VVIYTPDYYVTHRPIEDDSNTVLLTADNLVLHGGFDALKHITKLNPRLKQQEKIYNVKQRESLNPSRFRICLHGRFGFVIALRPQIPKHIRGGWSHYTDTSELVDGGVGTLQL
jgi:hypothetical protein